MRNFTIGIDLGGTNIKIGLVGQRGEVVRKKVLTTNKFKNKNLLINAFVDSIKEVAAQAGINLKDIAGVGIGVPGPVNSLSGVIHFFPNIPGWSNVPLKKILQGRLNLPVSVDNDANLVTLAEWKYGAGKGADNIVGLTLGTGVGGGVIIEGKLYRGENFTAGEVGHIPINEDGPRCNCGGRGCLERYVGNRYILKEAKKRLKNKNLTLEELTRLANKGNRIAIEIWQATGRHLGVALSGVVNVLNPAKIVIGGGVSGAGKILFDSIKSTIKKRAMPAQVKCVKVVRAQLGDDAGIIGAAVLVKDKLEL